MTTPATRRATPEAWIHQRADWIRAATPVLEGDTDPSNRRSGERSRVHEFYNMTPRSVARALERIDAGREMIQSSTRSNTPPPVLQSITLVPDVSFDGGGGGSAPPSTQSVPPPAPNAVVPPAPQTANTPANHPGAAAAPTGPGPGTQPSGTKPAAPDPSSGAGNAAEQGSALPGTTSPAAPVATESVERPGVAQVLYPNTTGRSVGESWTDTRNGFTYEFSIPEGNNGQSVDQKIRTADGTVIATARIAYDGAGGFEGWVDTVGGGSAHTSKSSASSNAITGLYDTGTPTTSAPDDVYATLPDLETTFELVQNGEVVGSINTSGEGDLLETIYTDRYNNLTTWRTNPTEHGPLITNQTGQFNSIGQGWMTTGQTLWSSDGYEQDGRQRFTNTEYSTNGVYSRSLIFSNADGQLPYYSEDFVANNADYSYKLVQDLDGFRTVARNDGYFERSHPDLGIVERRLPEVRQAPARPDLRSNWQKFQDFTHDVLDGVEFAYDNTVYGLKSLTFFHGLDQAKEAWIGLASAPAIVGLALTSVVISDVEFLLGADGVSFDTLTSNRLDAANEISIFLIGTDWSRFDEDPGETIGTALFGGALFFAPKGIAAGIGNIPPGAGSQVAAGASRFAAGLRSADFTAIGRAFDQLGPQPLLAGPVPGAAWNAARMRAAMSTSHTGGGSNRQVAGRAGDVPAMPSAPVPSTSARNSNTTPPLPADALMESPSVANSDVQFSDRSEVARRPGNWDAPERPKVINSVDVTTISSRRLLPYTRNSLDAQTVYNIPGDMRIYTDETGRPLYIEAPAGNKNEGFTPELRYPLPDAVYRIDDRFTYRTDDRGRVVEAHADALVYRPTRGVDSIYRNDRDQSKVGNMPILRHLFQGGHLFADVFGGPGDRVNLVPMDAKVNGSGGDWGRLERLLRDELKGNPNAQIEVNVIIEYSGQKKDPYGFVVEYRIDDGPVVEVPIKNRR